MNEQLSYYINNNSVYCYDEYNKSGCFLQFDNAEQLSLFEQEAETQSAIKLAAPPKTALIIGFCGKNHSWSHTHQGIARGMIANGVDVDMFSTNGISHFPDDLKPCLIGYVEEGQDATKEAPKVLRDSYDIVLSYTAPLNWDRYLSVGANK